MALVARGESVGAITAAGLKSLQKKYEELDVEESFDFVPHCRLVKMYDGDFAKLELVCDKEAIVLCRDAMKQTGAKRLLGTAPAGGLEDVVQKSIDAMS